MIGIKQLLKKIMNIMNAYGEIGAIYICANDINPTDIFMLLNINVPILNGMYINSKCRIV